MWQQLGRYKEILDEQHEVRLSRLGGMRVSQCVQDVAWEALLQQAYFSTVRRCVSAASASAVTEASFAYQPLLALEDVRGEEKRSFAVELLPLVKREHEKLIAERVRSRWEGVEQDLCSIGVGAEAAKKVYDDFLQQHYYDIVAVVVECVRVSKKDRAGATSRSTARSFVYQPLLA